MKEVAYDRQAAVSYARRWALDRNPAFYDFDRIGGDCTNFTSQSIHAGSKIMNYTPVTDPCPPTCMNRHAFCISMECASGSTIAKALR